MEQTDSDQRVGGRGIMVERREGTRKISCMNGPRTWTTLWKLTVGVGSGMGRGGRRGKNWDNCNRITIKIIFKKIKGRRDSHLPSQVELTAG